MIDRLLALAPVIFTTVSLLAMPSAQAEDVKLPPTMTFTAYDTGTAGFNIAVAVGKMMKDKYGTDLRVLPAGNDVARLAPLRAGRAMSSAMGSGVYFAQGHGDQGPQGQARRFRGRFAGAEPELAGDPGVRRSQAKRRQDG